MLPHLLSVTVLQVVLVTQTEGWKGVVGRVEVLAEVSQRYSATVTLVTLHNPHPRTDHVTLALILPADAFVSSLIMETGGRNITTKVEEKRRDTRTKPSRGPLSTQGSRRPATQVTQKFKASIKVAPLDQATFYVSYEQLLQRSQGRYTYTVHLPPYTGTGEQRVQVKVKETEVVQNLQVLQEPSPPSVKRVKVSDNEIILTYQRGGGGGEEAEGGGGEGRGEDASIATNTTTTSTDNNKSATRGHNTNNNNSSSGSKELVVNSRSSRSVSSENKAPLDENVLSLSYDVQRTTDGGEIQVLGRFFVHYLSPEGLPKLPAHTVFVLDVSGSMSDNGKLDKLKRAIIAIIRGMSEEDSFEVLVFSTRVRSLGVYSALPHEVEEGVAKIQALQALGGTNINDALLQAVMGANSHNATHAPARQVVFLTDGKPNIGETRPEQLRRNVREANLHQLPVFSLALGQDADVRLLRQVSADNEGFTRTISEEEQPGEELQEFYSEISSPLLTDVDVMYNEDEVDRNSVIRHGPSNFYSGSEVVFAGQLREGKKEVHPVVAGRGKEGPLQLRVSRTYNKEEEPVKDNHVQRLWAYLTVQDLLDAVEIVDDRNLRVEMRARAKEIAVRFQFVTKLTTLKVDGTYGSQTHPGLKSAPRHHKSRTEKAGGEMDEGAMDQDFALLSPSDIAETLPPPLSNRIYTSSPSSSPYFGDNDPHFVVQVPGMTLPLCFDIHASHGSTLSLIRDPHSEVVVNGKVTEAVGRPGNTYFTSIFISLAGVNFTISTTDVTVDCLDEHGRPTVEDVTPSLWPEKRRKAERRRYRRRKEQRSKRKSHSREERRLRRRESNRERRASRPPRHTIQERRMRRNGRRRRRRRRRRSIFFPGVPQGVLAVPPQFSRRRVPRQYVLRSSRNASRLGHPQHNHAFNRFNHPPQTVPYLEAKTHDRTARAFHHLPTSPKTIAHLQPSTHDRPLTTDWTQGSSGLLCQSPHTQLPLSTTLSRHVRESRPQYHQRHHVLHPQARDFMHPQAGVDISSPRFLHGPRRGRVEDSNEEEVYRECSRTFSWKKISERRYGQVAVTLRNHRKIDFLLGDVSLNLVVTRSRSAHGQHFLGVYLERRALLSPNTTGIIGQFVYKTVGTIGRDRPGGADGANQQAQQVRLAVVQPGPQRRYQVSEVNAFLSSRRSLLHKTQVTCLYIRDQGRGLVAGVPEDYLLPCLQC